MKFNLRPFSGCDPHHACKSSKGNEFKMTYDQHHDETQLGQYLDYLTVQVRVHSFILLIKILKAYLYKDSLNVK